MKSGRGRHIFLSFLCFLQIRFFLCQIRTQEVTSPSYHKYAFATSYAWKFRFPIPYSSGDQDGTVQWRPNIRYSQEQIQLPNEYLTSSNYPGRYVKDHQTGPQTALNIQTGQQSIPNILTGQQYALPSFQRQQFIQQPSLDGYVPTNTPVFPQGQQLFQVQQGGQTFIPIFTHVPQMHQPFQVQQGQSSTPVLVQDPALTPLRRQGQQQFMRQDAPTPQVKTLIETPTQQQPALQLPLLNDQGQQIGWQFFPLPREDQQIQDRALIQQPAQGYFYVQQPPTTGVQDLPIQQFASVPVQTYQPQSPLSNQGQQIIPVAITTEPGLGTAGTGISQQRCHQQFGISTCPPSSAIANLTPGGSFSSGAQNQDVNRLLQSYQQNLLQALLSNMQQATLAGSQLSGDSKSPVAIAGATISDDKTGTSHLNSFTYTNA